MRLAALAVLLGFGAFWALSRLVHAGRDPNLPWNEEYRILPEGAPAAGKTAANQVSIERTLRYKADAKEEDQPRGEVNMYVYPDGTVKGLWTGEFDANGTQQLVMAASFRGNTDATRKYPARKKEGKTPLYFITKGTYSILETRVEGGTHQNIAGYIYVRGWIYEDMAILGELVITEDKKTHETFTWSAEPLN
jgi:hypothetical protein